MFSPPPHYLTILFKEWGNKSFKGVHECNHQSPKYNHSNKDKKCGTHSIKSFDVYNGELYDYEYVHYHEPQSQMGGYHNHIPSITYSTYS